MRVRILLLMAIMNFIFLWISNAEKSCFAQESPRTERPNVILILADDLGACDLSYSGSPLHETPHIDRLAHEGTVFTSGYAACAVCSPTRAALQTGKTPCRTGITDWIRARFQHGTSPEVVNGQWPYERLACEENPKKLNPLECPKNNSHLSLEEVTIAERFKTLGYRTGHIGKWHLGTDAFFPEKQGYDVNIGGCDLGQPPSYFDPYYVSSTQWKPGNAAINPRLRITTLKPEKQGEFLTHREAREAVKFMKECQGKPFYLQVAHYAVHSPIMCMESVRQKYLDKLKERKTPQNTPDSSAAKPKEKKQNNQNNARYAGLVESIDDALGTIIQGVKDLGLEDNTIIIFTSDNGGYTGFTDNFPLRHGKGTPYEGGLRVPLVIYIPEALKMGNAPKTTDMPFSTYDIMPTLLDLVGAPLSDQQLSDQQLDGRSLAGVLRGEVNEAENVLYWHFPHYRRGYVPYSVIRDGEWKLIRFYHEENNAVVHKFELYHLKKDPSEQKNLAASRPEIVQRLDKQLTSFLNKTGARLPRVTNETPARTGK